MQVEDYEAIGRLIYGYHRMRTSFDSFCQSLEGSAQPSRPDTRVSELAQRAEARLTGAYGEGSPVVAEFAALANLMREGEERLDNIKSGLHLAQPPGDADIARLLSCQPRLEQLRQLMGAA